MHVYQLQSAAVFSNMAHARLLYQYSIYWVKARSAVKASTTEVTILLNIIPGMLSL